MRYKLCLLSSDYSDLEIFIGDCETVHDLCVYRFFFEVDEVHFAADLLQRRLRAERRQISTHVTVRFARYLFKIFQ